MKNEDVEKKLNDIEIPEINFPEHRQNLKALLLSKGIPEKSGFLRDLAQKAANGLFSLQPVWKTGSIGLAVTAIAVILSVMIPSIGSNSVYAKTMDIIKYSETIRKTLSTSDNQSSKVYTVTLDGNEGTASLDEAGRLIITFPSGVETMDTPTIVVGKYNKDGEPLEMTPDYLDSITLSGGIDKDFNYIIVILDE